MKSCWGKHIKNHDINEVHQSFQSFPGECFTASNNPANSHQKLINFQ
jgi:hypothetical protein